MSEKIDYQLLLNYTRGKYSFGDYKRIAAWFRDNDSRDDIRLAIRDHWDDFSTEGEESPKNLENIYNHLLEQIQQEQPAPQPLYKRVITLYSKIAAVLLLPLMIYAAISLGNKETADGTAFAEIYAPPGARTRFILPDGSNGWLNSNTRLKYPLNFTTNRHLELSGEAYFEVSKNAEFPFTVSTSALDIRVLGTIFSVSAIPEDNTTEVILQEGSVELDNPGIGLRSTIDPDQKFTFNKSDRKYQTSAINAQQYNAWKDGLLIFRNEPLGDVFKRLSRWYNVKINITDQQITKYKYRATFKNEPIEEVIRLIALTVPIEYKIQKRAYDEQGLYTVREITIMKHMSRNDGASRK